MSTATIGPLSFDRGFYFEKNNDYGVMDGKEKFTIRGPIWQINQLRGLITRGGTEESGGITTRSTVQKDWGPIWVNAADVNDDTRDNVRLNHKGWYLLRDVDITHTNEKYAKATLTLELINNIYDVLLEMDYTTSPYAGTPVKHGYDLTEELVLLDDEFATLDTGTWKVTSWNITGGSATVSSGKLALSGARTSIITGSPQWGARSIQSKDTFDAPFYVEADLQVPTLAGGANWDTTTHHIVIQPGQWSDNIGWQDTFLIISAASNSARQIRLATATEHVLVQNISSGITTTKWKMLVEENGLITIWLWNTSTSEWDFFWKGPSNLSKTTNLNVGITYHSHETTSRTVYTDRVKVYKTQDQVLRSVAKIPNTSRNSSTGIGSRGNVYLHKNGETDNTFRAPTNPINLLNGSPRVVSNYNPGSILREIYSPYESLKKELCSFYNDHVKISPTSAGINFYHKLTGEWALLNTFTIGDINYIKILNYTPEELIFQINRTIWTLRRGEPLVYVEHPYTPIGYSKKTTVYHDNLLNNGLADGVDVSMLSQHYALVFNPFNLLSPNQTNLENGTTEGWISSGESNISITTDSWYGTYAIKVVTTSDGYFDGMRTNDDDDIDLYEFTDLTDFSGLQMLFSTGLKGIGIARLYVYELDESKSTLTSHYTPDITLSKSYVGKYLYYTIQNANTRYLRLYIVSPTYDSSFEVKADQMFCGPIHQELYAVWAVLHSSENKYGLMINQKNPTTIKSNSIPACELTGLGVFDQMQPPSSPDSFNNLALEWLNPVNQRMRIVNRV
jgi:hypothetical protein